MNGKTNASDVTINQIVNGVLIPLEPATDFKIGSGTGSVYFTWADPVDKYTTPGNEMVSQWEKSVVVRKRDSAPTNIDDGTVVLTETTRNQYQLNAFVDTKINQGNTYYYSVFPVTSMDVVSDPIGSYVEIPVSGEPGYLAFLDSVLGDNLSNYASCGANGNYCYFAGGYNSRNDYPTTDAYSIDQDLTVTRAPYLERNKWMMSVGELQDHVLFFGDWSSRDRSASVYNLDNTRSTLTNDIFALLPSVVSRNRFIILAGSNVDTSELVSSINTDLTIQSLESLEVATEALIGTKAGGYNIFSLGISVDSDYDYVEQTSYAYDNDLTKVQIDKLASTFYTRNDREHLASCIESYALFLINTNNDDGLIMCGYTYDLTALSDSMFSTIKDVDLFYLGYGFTYDSSKQFGDYAYFLGDGQAKYGNETIVVYVDKNLTITSKNLAEYGNGINEKLNSFWLGMSHGQLGNRLFIHGGPSGSVVVLTI